MFDIDFYKRLNRLEKRRKGIDFFYNMFDSINEGVILYSEFDSLKNIVERW